MSLPRTESKRPRLNNTKNKHRSVDISDLGVLPSLGNYYDVSDSIWLLTTPYRVRDGISVYLQKGDKIVFLLGADETISFTQNGRAVTNVSISGRNTSDEEGKTLFELGYRKIEDLSEEEVMELSIYQEYHLQHPDAVFREGRNICDLPDNSADCGLPVDMWGSPEEEYENSIFGRNFVSVMSDKTLDEHFKNHPFRCDIHGFETTTVSDYCIHRNNKHKLPQFSLLILNAYNSMDLHLPDLSCYENDMTAFRRLSIALKHGHSLSSLDEYSHVDPANWSRRVDSRSLLNNINNAFVDAFGVFFIAKCPKCGKMQPGPLSLCVCCSLESNKPVPLFTCNAQDCWCNPNNVDNPGFKCDLHLSYVCPHKKEFSETNIFPVRSSMEVAYTLLYMNPKPLYDTTRTEQLGHAVHCLNTNQASWLTSANTCSCLFHQGEMRTAEVVYDIQQKIHQKQRSLPLPVVNRSRPVVSFNSHGINELDVIPDLGITDDSYIPMSINCSFGIPFTGSSHNNEEDGEIPEEQMGVANEIGGREEDDYIDDNPSIGEEDFFTSCLQYRATKYKRMEEKFGYAAYSLPYLEALDKAQKSYIGEGSVESPSWEEDGLSSFAQLTAIREKAYSYYANIPHSISMNGQSSWKPSDKINTIRFEPPPTGTIIDRSVKLILHIDGKPAKPRSCSSSEFIIYSYRCANGNSYDLHSEWIIIPILVFPKYNEREGYSVEEWRADFLAITDLLLFHANFIGLSGSYIKRDNDLYHHITWDEVAISGDSVEIEEIQGSAGKKNSRFLCTMSPHCKCDKFRHDQGIYVDLANTVSEDTSKCRMHALRSAPYNSAAALLPIIAGRYQVDGQSIQEYLKKKYPWLHENFVTDADVIQSLLRPYYQEGSFFFLPPSPLHPLLRRVVQCEQLKQMIEDGSIDIMGREKTQDFIVKTTKGEVNAVDVREWLLPTITNPIAVESSFENSIFGIIRVRMEDFEYRIPKCITNIVKKYPAVSSLLGVNDERDINKQFILLRDFMLTPYIGGDAMDGMHLGGNEIQSFLNNLCGKHRQEQVLLTAQFLEKYFGISHENSFTIITDDIINELNSMKDIIPSNMYIPKFAVDSLKSKATSIIFKFGQSWFASITHNLKFVSFAVYCSREVLNLFAVLYGSRANIDTIISAQSLGNIFNSMLEGKMSSQNFTPSNHNFLHISDTIFTVCPCVTSNNFAPESTYAYIAKNMITSPRIEVTVNNRVLSYPRLACLLRRKNYIRFFALVSNAAGLVQQRELPQHVALYEILDGIKDITKANLWDDYGFSYCEYYFRTTYLDNSRCDSQSAQEYIKDVIFDKLDIQFSNKPNSIFQVCRWRDSHIYKSVIPLFPLSGSFLKEHACEIAYTMDNKGNPLLYLICGYSVCLVNHIPYIQALCLQLPYKYIHVLMSLHYLVLDLQNQFHPVWKLISLYRLHMKEGIVEEREDGEFVFHVSSSVYSQSNNMSDSWEFYDNETKVDMIDPNDAKWIYRIASGSYDNSKLLSQTEGSKVLAIRNQYNHYVQTNSLNQSINKNIEK